MPKTLTEEVVDGLVGFIETDLSAKLTAITSAAGDGLVIPAPFEIVIGERPAIDYPTVWVLGSEVERETDENLNAYLNQFPVGLWRHTIEIVSVLTDPDDPIALRRKLYRYVRALTEVVMDHEHESDLWVRARVTHHSFSRTFVNEETNMFRQDAWVFLEVSRGD